MTKTFFISLLLFISVANMVNANTFDNKIVCIGNGGVNISCSIDFQEIVISVPEKDNLSLKEVDNNLRYLDELVYGGALFLYIILIGYLITKKRSKNSNIKIL